MFVKIIDFHTHAFADDLAARAVPNLGKKSGISAKLDGTVASLLASMDRAGIERSVVCSIATKPTQFQKILDWSKAVRSPRIVPLPSIHPADPKVREHLRLIRDEGFRGIKLHPYYQDFDLDDPGMDPIYESIRECGLLLVCHTGFDLGFARVRRADPERIWKVAAKFPGLKFVATHLGAWDDWAEVERWLIGKPVLVEMSFAISFCGAALVRRLLMAHPSDCIMFGTDSPWADQTEAVALVKALKLPPALEQKLFSANALRLLGG